MPRHDEILARQLVNDNVLYNSLILGYKNAVNHDDDQLPVRPALTRCLKALDAGDTLIVWKLDQLARSVRDLTGMMDVKIVLKL